MLQYPNPGVPTKENTMPFNHTGTLDAAVVARLIEVGLANTNPAGIVNYGEVEKVVPVNYNRGWLIVRYAWLERNQPELLLDMSTELATRKANQDRITAELTAEAKKASGEEADRLANVALNARFDADRHYVGAIAAE